MDQLHDRHQTVRAIHASASILQIDTGTGLTAATSVSASDAVPVLYIFPANKEDQSRSKLVAHELQVRPAALTLKETIAAEIAKVATIGSDRGDAFTNRVEHARMALEPDNKTWLTPMALYALYRHCLESLASKNVDLSASGQDTALDKVLKVQWDLVTGKAADFLETPDLDTHQQYVEFLLFHRRHRKRADPPKPLPTPDFHELQGLLHSYPAMLRPLGLAFDLTCQAPRQGSTMCKPYPTQPFPPFRVHTPEAGLSSRSIPHRMQPSVL
ncbi:hypothetical protein RBB78_25125 (plasmid) [Tunturiibacter empetritectus]|uniref:hypothetical protein n=1 Tax=Tunturiibacter empetritectus TaxID=3069691 RepID=UPI003D9ACE92